ncbi:MULTISPECIES: hypothetical protein [unclassified Rhodococcus (in: high G+C Gram-positive bacteria)]|uniref:hypothetical protein n=1 Tax=unclassified Rhodococcus (in: high G+C Gram-positive bacteria) TaxID=192944 RepID=UPI001179B040|nr:MULTISPECIES: hypothetical protein [unclassified Rhodococcus (in: high G+C Gram-positive bacteria)]
MGDVGRSSRITAASNDIVELAREWSEYRREYGTTFRNVAEIAAALRERDNTIAKVRELHVRSQDGSWTCDDWNCEKCTLGAGHSGPVCDTCSFSTDDDIVPSVVFWPCPTVQIIDNLPAPGLRTNDEGHTHG